MAKKLYEARTLGELREAVASLSDLPDDTVLEVERDDASRPRYHCVVQVWKTETGVQVNVSEE